MSDRLTKRFQNIRQILRPYAPIWSREVLNFYPESMEAYPSLWIHHLANLDDQTQFLLDSKQDFSALGHPELESLFTELEQISILDQASDHFNLMPFCPSSTTFLGVKDKKKHELLHFFSLFQELQKSYQVDRVTNVGGGVGHISRIITQHFLLPSSDIDMNAEFQQIGRDKMRLYPHPEGAPSIDYVTLKIDELTPIESLAPYFTPKHFITGLHTCGELAVRLLETAVKMRLQGILNFGCCYGLMEDPKAINLSKVSQSASEGPLWISPHALTLATRAHQEESFDSFKLKKRVKAYRYGLHLYNLLERCDSQFITVGNGDQSLYQGDFAQYYLFMMKRLGNRESDLPPIEHLNDFFQREEIVALLAQMYAMDLIRWQFGKPLERYLLLDRALYLQEQGYQVKLFTLFDESLSPRNIAILGTLR